jgi:ATP-dependent Clp protease ATP-binding subunit ClpB
MNLEKFTDRAKGFLQAAQTLAIRLSTSASPRNIS